MLAMSRHGVRSFEQPIAADDIEGLRSSWPTTQLGVMADESLNNSASLRRLVQAKSCTAVNVRISKCGGLIAATNRAREALVAGLTLQLGCQVGESSLLSAAHLRLAQAVQPVTYAEGCFGRFLLREDPALPVLQFGYGGRPPQVSGGHGAGRHNRHQHPAALDDTRSVDHMSVAAGAGAQLCYACRIEPTAMASCVK